MANLCETAAQSLCLLGFCFPCRVDFDGFRDECATCVVAIYLVIAWCCTLSKVKCLGGFGRVFPVFLTVISMYHVASFFWVQKQRKIQLYQRYPLWSCCGNSRKMSQNFSAEASLPRLLSEREGLAVELPSNQALVGSPEEKILHLSPWIIHECTERNTITHPSKSKSRNKNYSAAVLGSSYNSWSDIMTI